MNGQIWLLIILGLLLANANGKVAFPPGWFINPPMAIILVLVLVANLLEYGPKIWKNIKHLVKSSK